MLNLAACFGAHRHALRALPSTGGIGIAEPSSQLNGSSGTKARVRLFLVKSLECSSESSIWVDDSSVSRFPVDDVPALRDPPLKSKLTLSGRRSYR